jgi:predicted DNA-binding transcriptional regulator YafY
MVSLFPTHGLAKPSSPAVERVEGAWRVYPLEGALELLYHDAAGNPSIRRIIARELKVGPGKTLLGGIDMADDHYRGFRADRIDRIVDAETDQVIDRNILDWLIKRAEVQEKERRRESRRELLRAKRQADAAKAQKSDG